LPVQTYAYFAAEDLLSQVVLEPMLAGVATRRHARTAEPVGVQVVERAKSTSRSAVSRRFVRQTETALAELMSRDLSELNIKVLMLDAEHMADRCVVVALAITRIVLAFRATRLGDLGLKHCLHHCQPRGHAHRQQALPRRAGDIGHRQRDLLRQIRQHHAIGRVNETNSRYGLHGGPFLCGVYLVVHPKTYHQAGLRLGTATSNSSAPG
jgi:hypothetical protein